MKTKYIVIALATVMVTSCKQSDNQSALEAPSKTKVETKIVTSAPVATTLRYTGQVIPEREIPLSFQLPGIVVAKYIEEGDIVKKGELLAAIDKGTLASTYTAALATQKQAQDAYNRLKKVYDKGSLPEIQWQEITAKLAQANTSAEICKINLDKTRLYAPSDGVIGTESLEIGATVNPFVSLINLVTITQVGVKISVPENEINILKKDLIAQVRIGALGGTLYTARINKIGVLANRISKTYEVKLLMNNPNIIIKPGMVCDVSIVLNRETNNDIVIPIGALMNDHENNAYVYVIDTNTAIVSKRTITVGTIISDAIQVNSGISLGEVIVVSGQQKISNNETVCF